MTINKSRKIIVSIVIVAFNEEENIANCLDSLCTLDFPAETREIIVVDNASTDRTKEIILTYPVTYVYEPQRGRAVARNRGIHEACGEFVAFTDADCRVDCHWLIVLAKEIMTDKEIGVCTGDVKALEGKTIFEKYMRELEYFKEAERASEDHPRLTTANALFRKKALSEIGCFDEELPTLEDFEISWRLMLRGYLIRYVSKAVVQHDNIKTLSGFCAHHMESGQAAALINRKYRGSWLAVPGTGSMFAFLQFFIKRYYVLIRQWIQGRYLLRNMKKLSFLAMDILRFSCHLWGIVIMKAGLFLGLKRTGKFKEVVHGREIERFNLKTDLGSWKLKRPLFWCKDKDLVHFVPRTSDFQVLTLNRVAADIWTDLLELRNLKKVAENIARRYNIKTKIVENDIQELLTLFCEKGIFVKKD